MALQWLAVTSLLSIGLQVAADCKCKYQGTDLPSSIYTGTAHASLANIKPYGTMCAAWDAMPDTPNYGSCNGTDFSGASNWCQVPWCYVDSSCGTAVASSAFDGASLHYSYETCGGVDCFGSTGGSCPYDPNSDLSYTIHKSGDCACLYHGSVLPAATYMDFPTDDAGKYKDLDNIAIYGTTCAAWDMAPGTPWVGSCPSGADWCRYDYNWCMAPWCYVDAACSTKVASSVFTGSNATQYSYNTCVNTPDCYTNSGEGDRANLPATCPYDSSDNSWSTPKLCSEWTQAPSPSPGPSPSPSPSPSTNTDSASRGAMAGLLIGALLFG